MNIKMRLFILMILAISLISDEISTTAVVNVATEKLAYTAVDTTSEKPQTTSNVPTAETPIKTKFTPIIPPKMDPYSWFLFGKISMQITSLDSVI